MKKGFGVILALSVVTGLLVLGACAAGATTITLGGTVTATAPAVTITLPGIGGTVVTTTVGVTQVPPPVTVTLKPGLPTQPVTAPAGLTTYPPFTPGYYGPGGMMGPGGWMGPGMMGPGMHGGWWQYGGERIGVNAAVEIVEDYLDLADNANLEIEEVMEFVYNYYFEIVEEGTGIGAFELLVDPYNGSLYPEPGPNMMWNTKYSMMYGDRWDLPASTTPLTISEAQAKTRAQEFLNTYASGSTVGDVSRFYGYYTMDTVKDGKTFGMLSVNGYTGQVWYHTWHGAFISEREL